MSKEILTRLPKGGDLVTELTRIAKENNITRGTVQVIGALEKAELGFYNQNTFSYESHPVDKNVELLFGMGNISLKDDEVFVHLHLTLSDATGAALGGHAMEGCIIFAGEAFIREVAGEPLNRVYDEATKLFLWG